MAEPTPEMLNHFAVATFSPEYWGLAAPERRQVRADWLGMLGETADALHLYQVAGLEAGADLLLWSASSDAGPTATGKFFAGCAAALAPVRRYVSLRETLWGYTRPSQYTKVRSTQELDPFSPGRMPFLIAYPFVKTASWYQLDREKRGEMMAGHIRTGTQYKDITQLLLYSFGLQDQEFVVVYETEDLRRFMALVNDLRATEARVYTQRDWPLHAGLHQPDLDALEAWL